MDVSSTIKYTRLSNSIFVPKEWPVKGIETFILSLAEAVIDNVTSGYLVILQVQNIPTKLAQSRENEETQFIFERISNLEQTDAYIIEVLFDKNFKKLISMAQSMESEVLTLESSAEDIGNDRQKISLDDYIILINESKNRVTYYFISSEKKAETLNPEEKIDYGTQQRSARSAKRRAVMYESLLLFIAFAIGGFTILTMMVRVKFD